jgi:two-component system chemotaxis response regulator CheY
MTTRRVLSVGQCGPDHGSIRRALQSAFAAEVTACDSAGEAIEQLRGGAFDLVLVNRVFDADGDSGLDLIRRLKADPELQGVPVMLVSNFEDAQAQAVAAGAAPGFGKSALQAAQTKERLRPYLGG